MTEISISSKAFERLQRHAKPLLDTSETVIMRALDALERESAQSAPESASRTAAPAKSANTPGERTIDPEDLPKLTHAKLIYAAIDGKQLPRFSWNSLFHKLLRRAMERTDDIEEIQGISQVRMVKGHKEDDGYYALDDLGISVPGLDSNGACYSSVALAKFLGVSLDIVLFWRKKDGAAYPGERGRITVAGKGA